MAGTVVWWYGIRLNRRERVHAFDTNPTVCTGRGNTCGSWISLSVLVAIFPGVPGLDGTRMSRPVQAPFPGWKLYTRLYTRRLHHALSVLSLSLDFWVSVVLLTRAILYVMLFCVICVFCLLVVLVRLSVPVQVIDWKDSSPWNDL